MKKLIGLFLLIFILVGCDISTIKPYLNPGKDTVIINQSWIDEGAYLLVGFNRMPMTTLDNVDTTKLGTHTIVYNITYEDQTYVIRRLVQVIASSDFSVDLALGIDTIRIDDTWIDAGLISSFEIEYSIIGSVDPSKEGTYRIEYHVTYQNNTKILIRYVTVIA